MLVILRRAGKRFTPITLGLRGSYNMAGAVSAKEDLNTKLVLNYFIDRFEDGTFLAADDTTRPEYRLPPTRDNIQSLIDVIERTTTCSEVNTSYGPNGGGHKPSTLLDDDFVVHALIAQPVWDAISAHHKGPERPTEAQFTSVFTDPAAGQIYAGHIPELSTEIHELASVDLFLEEHGMAWTPPGSLACRYPSSYDDHEDEQVHDWLNRARADYHALPWMLAAIDECSAVFESQVRELDD
ncbi:hypothetical protein [Mycobacterium sp. 96-892]|uniref:hypothetical protein n=1 Tax=Mycobacterium sp. 96-892 TaxID=1855664 RepID=UPI001116948E|nr:hypothetical protein [Mycobacterium sp. 96-892]